MAAMLTITLGSGCGSESERVSIKPDGQSTASEQAKLTEEYVRQVAENKHGNPMVVREAVISGVGDEKSITIGIDRPATLQDGSVIGVMGSYGQHVFSSLFEIPEVAYVSITMYGVKQGEASDDVAMMIALDRNRARETDYSMFGPMMLSDMVSEYYVDPAIEGSGFSM